MPATETKDLLIIGGGINGAAIARDAVGRGLSVLLVEAEDLAQHTSSASTKLIHGGLRYLEYGEFRLVREALIERERLLAMAPHIIWPLRFVLPQGNSPRPAWQVRLGLFLYDHLGGRKLLPATTRVKLSDPTWGNGLKPLKGPAFAYSDCWVDDARLVTLTAMDAAARGADIRTRTRLISAARDGDGWRAVIAGAEGETTVHGRALVNAAGPWVREVIDSVAGARTTKQVRLIKGSHVVVPKLYEGDHAFMLQNEDRRIVFAIPYEGEFTLVGTTDVVWPGKPAAAEIDAEEVDYLLATANRYFERQTAPGDVARSYAGIRPLHEDHAASASAVTRDYALDVDGTLLSVFGGKITTHRKLAEHALALIGPGLGAGPAWTAGAVLPGGDLPGATPMAAQAAHVAALAARYPFLQPATIARIARSYGSRAETWLGDAETLADLGQHFGGGLTEAEVRYLMTHEWARTAEDVLWRRSKLGLHIDAEGQASLAAWIAAHG